MGGVIILLAVVITSVFYIPQLSEDHPDLICHIGLWADREFLDDYLKVVMKRSDGLYPKQKMALQIVVTAIFAFYLVKFTDVSLAMLIPFSGGQYLNIGWLAIPLLFFAVIGTVNGVNFTDGLDGLASSVTVLVATFFTVVAVGTEASGISPDHLCGGGSTVRLPVIQCISCQCVYGRHWVPGTGRVCGFHGLYAADAYFYHYRRADLSGRSIVCHHSGHIF